MSLFLIQIRSELKKLFARRRTYIGYGAFLILELVILWVFHLDKPREEMAKLLSDAGLDVDHYYSALTVTYWMIGFSMAMLGATYQPTQGPHHQVCSGSRLHPDLRVVCRYLRLPDVGNRAGLGWWPLCMEL